MRGPFMNPGFPGLPFQSLTEVEMFPWVPPGPPAATRSPWVQPPWVPQAGSEGYPCRWSLGDSPTSSDCAVTPTHAPLVTPGTLNTGGAIPAARQALAPTPIL